MTSSSAHTTTHPMQLDLLLPKIIHECTCNLPIHHSATYPLLNLIYIIDHLYVTYKAEIVCLCVCVFAICARVSCSIVIKLAVVAGGIGCQVIAGFTASVLRFAESYPSISAFSFADDRHFLITVPVDFWLLQDVIRYHPTFEFKPIIINF